MCIMSDLKELAREKGVSFSITYDESCNKWNGGVSSIAPSEEYESPDRTELQDVVDNLILWMVKL